MIYGGTILKIHHAINALTGDHVESQYNRRSPGSRY